MQPQTDQDARSESNTAVPQIGLPSVYGGIVHPPTDYAELGRSVITKILRARTDPNPDPYEKPGSVTEVNGQLIRLRINARRHEAEQLCKKAASIELASNPDLYVGLFGGNVQWALDIIQQNGGSTIGSKYVWVTINPECANIDPIQQWTGILGGLRILLALGWTHHWWVVIEQREEVPNPFNGLHVHMIIDRGTYVPAHCKRDIIRAFRAIVGNEKHIRCENLPEKLFPQKYRYMCGQKTADQGTKPENDKLMRKALHIPDMITSKDPYPIFGEGSGSDDDEKDNEESDSEPPYEEGSESGESTESIMEL